MVIGACLWIQKGLWEELGGFPEWFGSIAEDMYLCCRARLAGYKRPREVHFIAMDEMPRSASGKIVREALERRLVDKSPEVVAHPAPHQ